MRAIINNLFFSNGVEDLIDFSESVILEGNIFSSDPYIDNTTFMPALNSPCIDAGIKEYSLNEKKLIEIEVKTIKGAAPDKTIKGAAPDIGAIEIN